MGEETKRTYGDTGQCECPACGAIIRDLWDYHLAEGIEIECPQCNAKVIVEEIPVTVVLRYDPPTQR